MPKRSIINAIEGYEAETTDGGQLASERARGLEYYQGILPAGNGLPDRSQIVSRDVSDAIERLKPAIIRVFCSGDDVVSFDPIGQEDTDAAQQETDFVNHIITQKNPWFEIAYQWFDDALIQKNGYVKAWFDESEDLTKETYHGQSDDQVAMLLQDPEVSVIEMSSYDNPMALLMQPVTDPATGQRIVPKLYDLTMQRTRAYGCVKFCGLPPERVRVYKMHKDVSLENCEFVEHIEDKTLSQLRLDGFDVDDDLNDEATATQDSDVEEIARNRFNERVGQDNPQTVDPAMRKVRVRECWIRFDEDDDGKSELRHVIVVGVTELLNEECDLVPIAALTPRIWPHRHVGMAIADFAKDIQDIKTQFHRGLVDNVNYAINGRTGVNKNKVNVDDVLSSRPGGVIRVDGEPGANIMQVTHQPNFAPLLSSLQYFDTVLEERTGANRSSGQLNPETLARLPSGIAISQIMSAAQAPVELISRVFAETGVKQLFRIVHALTLKNARKAEIVRLRNKWVMVDPRQWKKRADMTISVGLGTGNREQQATSLQAMTGMQLQLLPLGLSDKKTLFHVLSRFTQAQGFKDVQSFWNDPGDNKQLPAPQQPQADPAKVAELQLKAKTEQGKLQIDAYNAQTNRIKVSHDASKMAHDATMDKANLLAAQKPGDEASAMRDEAGAASQQMVQASQQLMQAMAQLVQGQQQAAARDEQMMQVLLHLAKPKSKVIQRGANGKVVAAHEVLTETLQ